MAPPEQGPPARQYIIKPYLPKGQVHVLAGSSGAGKSTLIIQLLHAPDIPWPSTLYITTDRTNDSLQELYERLGIATPHIHVVNLIDEMVQAEINKTPITRDWTWATTLLQRFSPRPECVIVDPAPPLLSIKNLNDMSEAAKGMLKVAVWARLNNITVFLIFHTNKTKRSDDFLSILNRISGSHGLLGYASSKALLMTAEENDGLTPALYIQGQNFADLKVHLERNEDGAFKLATTAEATRTEFTIFDHIPLDGTPITVNSLTKLSGTHKATVWRQLERLIERGVVLRIERGVYAINPLLFRE